VNSLPLYPLRFAPIFKDYIWGGRQLADWYPTAPRAGPIAEAWLVSDEAVNPSVVLEGELRGHTLRELISAEGPRLLGKAQPHDGRFPVLLKFLDAAAPLSVQVHPTDRHAAQVTPAARGKSEAWVVLQATANSRIFAGLQPGTTEGRIREALSSGMMVERLHSFTPNVGDCVFLPAGTVHALGAGLLIFEVQQTSDITYRLHDWDRVDAKTGKPRPLHIDESLACTNFDFGPCQPVEPERESPGRERLVDCEYFRLWRCHAREPMQVGMKDECRILAPIAGAGTVDWDERKFPIRVGDVLMLPAEVGSCRFVPNGVVTLLEVGLPRCKST